MSAMRALVVYESMFGNTKMIAEEVARGLAAHMVVEIQEVGTAAPDLPGDVALLVVGGPTHVFGMTRASTRQSAAQQADGALVSPGNGIREWLSALRVATPVAAAAFDTRVRAAYLPGSAAKAAHKALRRHGLRAVGRPMSFYVTGTKGPLEESEERRAHEWGESLAAAMAIA
ncbi:flavodoxin domain-containing protein [Sphaerisporangium sp. B11E5]|uniref:flavodoxin family protein n=1 Tax=Sphaerisporangium sp. B11E5 TaxID=3153563 RepID=UPI00325F0999